MDLISIGGIRRGSNGPTRARLRVLNPNELRPKDKQKLPEYFTTPFKMSSYPYGIEPSVNFLHTIEGQRFT
jgi:hypothetical protein